MDLVAARAGNGSLPSPVGQMKVAPVDAAGTIRLAGARLVGIVAAGRADLAHLSPEAAISLHFQIKTALDQQIDAADAVARERDAERLRASVRELQNQPGPVLAATALCQGYGRAAAHAHEERQGVNCDQDVEVFSHLVTACFCSLSWCDHRSHQLNEYS